MSKSAPKGMSGMTKFYLTIILILIVAVIVVFFWKELAVRRAVAQYEEERAGIVEQTRTALVDQTREMLRLSAVPLGWSVRTEMIKENYHQIDDYMQRFVKEPHVSRIALVNYEGSIQIATDKKAPIRPSPRPFSKSARSPSTTKEPTKSSSPSPSSPTTPASAPLSSPTPSPPSTASSLHPLSRNRLPIALPSDSPLSNPAPPVVSSAVASRTRPLPCDR
jgi:hypothetical protein